MRASSCLRLLLGVCLAVWSAAAAAQSAVTSHPVSVYAGPDDSYPMVAQLDADAPVQVMGCLDDWSWCDVTFEDNRGWLYAPDITYDYEGDYVPLYTYAPSLGIPVVQFTIGEYWERNYHTRPWYAQRDEWVQRGPPPSAGPPPRSVRADRPSAERHDRARDNGDARQPEPRSAERAPSPQRAEGARHEETRHGEKPGDRPNDSPH